MRKIRIILILLLCSISVPAFAVDDNLLLANVHIIYGEENFRQRIEERTGGTREPIGLVLSGGSARAFAHIGVLKYLEEQGIVPDFIIGNSMGSIIALMYSAGLSPDQILEVCSEINITELFSISLPINSGVLGAEKFKSYVRQFIPKGTMIEELSIPVMIVNEDLVTKRQIWITEGDYAEVMSASFAIPVYFDSVEYGNHILIDGGFANLAPLDIAYNYSSFNIISTTFYSNTSLNLKNPITALNVSIDIGKTRQGIKDIQAHSDDSIWIRCDVEGFSYMQFSALNEIAQRGYLSAKNSMEEAKAQKRMKNTPHGKITSDMIKTRNQFDERIATFRKKYAYYNHVGYSEFNHSLSVGAKSFAYPNDPYLLRDDTMLGLQYSLAYSDWTAKFLAGFSWQAFKFGIATPAFNFMNEYLAFDALKLETNLSFFFDPKTIYSTYNPICYLSQGIFYTLPVLADNRLMIKTVYEMVNNYDSKKNTITNWNGLSHLITVSGTMTYRKDLYKTLIEVGSNMSIWNDSFKAFAFGKFKSEGKLISNYLKISGDIIGRFAVDGLGNVPFFMGDGFRTLNSEILTQGSQHTGTNNPSNVMVSATFEVGVDPSPGKTMTMGEIFIFQDLNIMAYCNLIWYKRKGSFLESLEPAIGAGIELKTEISLIGLRTFSLNGYLGYDGPNKGICGGFLIGTAE